MVGWSSGRGISLALAAADDISLRLRKALFLRWILYRAKGRFEGQYRLSIPVEA